MSTVEPSALNLSQEALQHLIKFEGVRYQVYDDATGKVVSSYSEVRGYPTIGVGHLITDGERPQYSAYLVGAQSLSEEQVLNLLRSDVEQRAQKSLRPRVIVPITQSMWDAMIIQAFNTGPNTNVLKETAQYINLGKFDEALRRFSQRAVTSKGKVLTGLVKRRDYEIHLFQREGNPFVTSFSQGSALPQVVHSVIEPWMISLAGVSVSGLFLLSMLRLRWSRQRRRDS